MMRYLYYTMKRICKHRSLFFCKIYNSYNRKIDWRSLVSAPEREIVGSNPTSIFIFFGDSERSNKMRNKYGEMMTLVDLQTILGTRVARTLDDMEPEERQIENAQSALIAGLAKQMIQNGDLILRTEKLLSQNKSLTSSVAYTLIEGKPYKEIKNEKAEL